MIDVGLVVARFLHYAASTTLAGVAFFPLYAYVAQEPRSLVTWRSKVLLWSAVLALLSGLAWFVFAVANMSGAVADVANPEILASVLVDTGFGTVWAVRMVLAVVIVAAAALCSSHSLRRLDLLMSFLTAALLASLAGAGHAQIEQGWAGAMHVLADAAHLLAAGAWLGGLAPLGVILLGYAGRTEHDGWDVGGVLMRFSGMGYAAVATLVGTGLLNSWLLVGSFSSLLNSVYGQILIAKLALFAGMLALAAANRFWLVPALETAGRRGDGADTVWRSELRMHIIGEQGLGLLVLLCVSILGTIRPAIGQ